MKICHVYNLQNDPFGKEDSLKHLKKKKKNNNNKNYWPCECTTINADRGCEFQIT